MPLSQDQHNQKVEICAIFKNLKMVEFAVHNSSHFTLFNSSQNQAIIVNLIDYFRIY